MTHSFLLQSAKWSLEGQYCDSDRNLTQIDGSISITWKREYWYKMITKINLEESGAEIVTQCKGHLDNRGKSYTYVLQHSILGNIEGEGWLGSDSIIQHYWIVGSTRHLMGFETFYRSSEDRYHFTSILLENRNLKTTMEATLKYLI